MHPEFGVACSNDRHAGSPTAEIVLASKNFFRDCRTSSPLIKKSKGFTGSAQHHEMEQIDLGSQVVP